MKNLEGVLLFFLMVTMVGCPSASRENLAGPDTLEISGPFSHIPSGMKFPQAVENFKRSIIKRYDVEGTDVSVGYDLYQESKVIAATVYVYPSPSIVSIGSSSHIVKTAQETLCLKEFDVRKWEISRAHPGAKLIQEKDVSSPVGRLGLPGKSAIFEYEDLFAGVRQSLLARVDLYCYVAGKWNVKYRFSYPATFNAMQDLSIFKEYLLWPEENP